MGKSYRDLVVWQKAMDLVTAIYRLTAHFPREEMYGLTSQLRRAAVSVSSNIAEGQGRHGVAEFRHFLRQACGSLMEIETQVLIAERLGYISPSENTSAPEKRSRGRQNPEWSDRLIGNMSERFY